MDTGDITAAVVARLVREQFPQWADRVVRPVDLDGNDNTSFRLGDDLVARLPSHERSVAGVEREHRWLPYLGGRVPLPIPEPVAMGRPSAGMFPRPWSIYRWIEGEPAGTAASVDRVGVARDVAGFLDALQRVDASGGPPAGEANFWRGGPLARSDRQTRRAVAADAALAVWDAALATPWTDAPVWLHGDVAANNLLVRGGRLAAVIDVGTSAVGDPACDTVLAWTYLDGERREALRSGLPLDGATRARLGAVEGGDHAGLEPARRPVFTAECARVVATVGAEHALAS